MNNNQESIEKFSACNSWGYYHPEEILSIIHNPMTPLHLLKDIAKASFSEAPYSFVIADYDLSRPEILTFIKDDPDEDVVRKVANHTNTTIETLVELSNNKNSYIRVGVAENPNTPIKTLEELSIDVDDNVRVGVAENPNTSINILKKMVKDSSLIVLFSILRRSDINRILPIKESAQKRIAELNQ